MPELCSHKFDPLKNSPNTMFKQYITFIMPTLKSKSYLQICHIHTLKSKSYLQICHTYTKCHTNISFIKTFIPTHNVTHIYTNLCALTLKSLAHTSLTLSKYNNTCPMASGLHDKFAHINQNPSKCQVNFMTDLSLKT